MNIYEIKACKANEFIPIIQELNSFNQARQSGVLINNVRKLVSLLKDYFRGLLYYMDNHTSSNIVKINKKMFQVKFGATDQNGKERDLNMLEIHTSLLREIFVYLSEHIDLAYFEELSKITNAVLLDHNIDLDIKISILNSENNHFQKRWHVLVREMSYELAVDTIGIRKGFLLRGLKGYLLEVNFETKDEYQKNIESIYNLYEFYSKTYLKLLIANGHFSDIQRYIKDEIKSLENSEKVDKKRLVTFNLVQLVLHNNLFQIHDKESIRDIVEEYEEYIQESNNQLIQDGLAFNPENFEVGDMKLRLFEPDFKSYDVDNDIDTVLYFVIPVRVQKDKQQLVLDDGTELYFQTIHTLYQDPIFTFLDEIDMNLNGMPITFFSDSIGNLQVSTLITIKLPYFYHPHFELVDDKFVEIDFSLEAAKRGGKYYPHKDLIIEKLHEAYILPDFPLEIEQSKITSNFISNYMIAYFSKSGKNIHHEVFTITNFDSYFKAKNRYIEDLNKFYIEDDLIDIKKFIEETKITNSRNFLDFCYKFLELTIKKAVEFGGLHSAFWIDASGVELPIHEPKAQPIIFNIIKDLAEMKGIQISREVEAADGSLDFYFSYNTGTELMKVCVELKNAHHNELKHGIETQLPLYIKDVGKKEGIFLVLWYKNDIFNKPKAYNSVRDLESFLFSKVPPKFKIKPLIIDCTKKISPSKKGSSQRL